MKWPFAESCSSWYSTNKEKQPNEIQVGVDAAEDQEYELKVFTVDGRPLKQIPSPVQLANLSFVSIGRAILPSQWIYVASNISVHMQGWTLARS